MTIFKNHNGSITISELVIDQSNYWSGKRYEDMTYYDYSKSEAIQRFKAHLKENRLEVA